MDRVEEEEPEFYAQLKELGWETLVHPTREYKGLVRMFYAFSPISHGITTNIICEYWRWMSLLGKMS